MSRMIGIRCDVVTKEEIQYILFYDIDRTMTELDVQFVSNFCSIRHLSYILYKTKNGHHLVCFTPLDSEQWGTYLKILKQHFGSYYGGIVIRLSRKEGEVQTLISMNLDNGEVIPNLYNLYTKRFNLKPVKWFKETSKHLLVFEKYRTEKQ